MKDMALKILVLLTPISSFVDKETIINLQLLKSKIENVVGDSVITIDVPLLTLMKI